MIPIKTGHAWRGTADCKSCGIREMVLFADLDESDFKLITVSREVSALVRAGAIEPLDRRGASTGLPTSVCWMRSWALDRIGSGACEPPEHGRMLQLFDAARGIGIPPLAAWTLPEILA
jgi:hypothetical protein